MEAISALMSFDCQHQACMVDEEKSDTSVGLRRNDSSGVAYKQNIVRSRFMGWGAEYIGAVLLALGAALTLASRKQRFDRTNQFGVEQFRSYWDKLGIEIKDGLLRYLSLVLFSAGLVILGFRYEDSWGWIITLPVYAFMLFLLFGS